MRTIRIISLDMSLRNTGYVIFDWDLITQTEKIVESGLIENKRIKPSPSKKLTKEPIKKQPDSSYYFEECRRLQSAIKLKIAGCIFITAEIPSGAQSADAYKSFGAVIAILSGLGIPVVQVTPLDVKKATGLSRRTASYKDYILQRCIKDAPDMQWIVRSGKILKKNNHTADAFYIFKAGKSKPAFWEIIAPLREKAKAAQPVRPGKIIRNRLRRD